MARLWKRLQAALLRLGIVGLIIAFIVGIVAAAYFADVFPAWTGFGPPPLDAQGHELPRAKTLWDWLGLLLVPLVLTVGGYFLTRSENRYALKLQERREEEARKLEAERSQDAALQAYLDQMTQLLLHEKLRTSQPDDEVRSVARARTLTVLRVLDGDRKATVVQFLYEARLIGASAQEEEGGVFRAIDAPVSLVGADLREAGLRGVILSEADLRGANLFGANLSEAALDWANLNSANLSEADLSAAYVTEANLFLANLARANLRGADLREVDLGASSLTRADLSEANLSEANLSGADLSGADLTDCQVTPEQLAQASSLEGAILSFDMEPPPAPEVNVVAPQNGQSEQKIDQPADAKHE